MGPFSSRWWAYAERFAPLRLEEAPPDQIGLRDGGTYVVAGGLGALGLSVAELLAEHARANLVLIDRDEPASGVRAAIARMEDSGSEVLVLTADVTNPEEVEHALRVARERFGSIHGAVHAAGARSGDTPDGDEVRAPKILGTMALDRALGDEPLDFFVLSSSASTAVGPPGGIDEVAANAFVEAYARSRSGHNTYTVAVAWGPPDGARGVSAREAGAALARILAGERRPVIAVSAVDLTAWKAELDEARAETAPAPAPSEPEAPSRHLVALAPRGREPPLFFLCFERLAVVRPLARALRHRAYALHTERAFESIEELARVYAEEIARARPLGPYLLGAANEAGALAFETAKQLRARGSRVALLAMIDARAPIVRSARSRIDFHLDRMRKRGVRHAAEWARERVEQEAARVRAYLDEGVAAAARRALDRYEWKREPGRVAFLRVGKEREAHGWDGWVDSVDVLEFRADRGADAEGIASPLIARALARGLDDAIERALETTP